MVRRENNRRVSNGGQYLMTVLAAARHPVSQQWKGYWQRGLEWVIRLQLRSFKQARRNPALYRGSRKQLPQARTDLAHVNAHLRLFTIPENKSPGSLMLIAE